MKNSDTIFMKRALTLAKRGRAWVAPNPMVGAVVVKNGKIVGEGYHKRFGGPHAEVNAINMAGDEVSDSTIYVSLEPCCHHGKTPPCTDLIIRKGIKRVVAAIEDPNPLVGGSGFKKLRNAGIEVVVGVLEEEAKELNCCYLKKASSGKSWITLKIAQSIDGRIATTNGHSQWITCEKSRKYVHLMRAMHDAVLVGAGTVKADNPSLTVRHVSGKNPIRIVLDEDFSIPSDSHLLNSPSEAETWVFGTATKRPSWTENPNVKVIQLPSMNGKSLIDLNLFHEKISALGVGSVLVEGGSKIWTSFLETNLVDKLDVFVAPLIIGEGISTINDLGILDVNNGIKLGPSQWRKIGDDMHLAARIYHEKGQCACSPD